MKKTWIVLLVAVGICSLGEVRAQGIAYKTNVPYVLPQTAVKVKLVVEQEVIRRGPYARFAQQYLGVQAPLNDKTTYRILGADLGAFNEADPSHILILENPAQSDLVLQPAETAYDAATQLVVPVDAEGVNDLLFSDMGINPIVYSAASSLSADRRTSRERTAEEMASDAASTIFTLRKRRFDLITGEAGENVYGAGLPAAIQEMRRIEDEYLSLFVGKKSLVRKVMEFDVVPEAGKSNLIVCRFSAQNGILDINDMTGEPIVLAYTPEGKITGTSEPRKGVKGSVSYRVADMTQFRLFNGDELLAVKRLPVYQFGTTVDAVVPTR